MYMLLSPAKSLNETDTSPLDTYSQPALIEHAQTLMKTLKQKDPIDLQELMGISDDLAQLNAARNQSWQTPFTPQNAKPAIYLFDGDVYTGVDAYHLSKTAMDYLQSHLGILSGLYGILHPLDLIQPYRLEMGTKLATERGDTLYDFWGMTINHQIDEWLKGHHDKVVVNLASNEYFKVVKHRQLAHPVITPRFEDEKNGTFKIISFYAKKARGLMARFAAENQITKAEDLKSFDLDGYYYCDDASDGGTWTFRRRQSER